MSDKITMSDKTITVEEILTELMNTSNVEDENNPQEISLWVKDKDRFVPSTNISLYDKLPEGLYKVHYNNSDGLFCKAIPLETDELYQFSDSITEKLMNEVEKFWSKKDLYKEKNLVYKRGILLAGKAGTGKTSYINMLSKELIAKKGIVFKVSNIREFSNYVEFIKYGFRNIEKETPIITIIEDIDQYSDVESDLLDFLDGQTHTSNHVVLATSNNTQNIPNTILRPSRIDLIIEVPCPSEQTRREYFEHKEIDPDLMNELIEKTDDFSFAEIKEMYICLTVLEFTIDEAISRVKNKHVKKNYLHDSDSEINI